MSLLDLTINKAEQTLLTEFKNECRRFFYIRKQKHRKSIDKWERECTYWNQWECIGSGFYSEAWMHRDYEGWVFKIGGSASWGYDYLDLSEVGGVDPWPLYAEYCSKVKGRNVPEILHLEKPSATSDMFWAIMPEYTSVLRCNSANTSSVAAVRDRLSSGRGDLDYEESLPKWFKNALLYVEHKHGDSVNVDLHQGNIMWDERKSRAVVTDPFSTVF